MKFAIEKAVYGGAGLARPDGKAVFVPLTLPGETVEATIRRDKGSFAEADLLAVMEPSADRVIAPCPYYGTCGGCQYQHATYAAQLRMKRSILVETLERAGLLELPAVEIHSGEPWGYRNRIRLHVDALTSELGYRRRASHALMRVDRCPIAAPLLEQALRALVNIFQKQAAGAWCASVELFTNENSSALLLSLEQRAGSTVPAKALEQVCAALQEQIPELSGAGLFRASEPPKRKRNSTVIDDPAEDDAGGPMVSAWGESSLTYRVNAEAYQVGLGAFFQSNRFLVEQLVGLVEHGGTGAHNKHTSAEAWDLFAGVGLFARVLARQFTQVVAVEGAPVSATYLRRNLAGHRVVESSTLAFLEGFSARPTGKRGPVPDRVVLDPPRAGLGAKAAGVLAGVRSQSITYVSCDPATLARDLRTLVDAGYILTRLHLVDMFPQTFHMETVAELRLG
jgi:23S rRNA (uracil1939-C5)-methyltransferase